MTDSQIQSILKLQISQEGTTYNGLEVYHYTETKNIQKILQTDKVSLRMTRVEDFEDEHEGRKTIEMFYDLSLERLLRNGIICQSSFEQMSKIELPRTTMFFWNDHKRKVTHYRAREYYTYIFCFSLKENDPHMIESYIKNEGHNGYCLSFYTENLGENQTTLALFDRQVRIQLSRVLYGEEVVDSLYRYLQNLVSILGNNDPHSLGKWGVPIIKEELSRMRYLVKRYRYSKENEVRLILMFPKYTKKKLLEKSQKLLFSKEENKQYVYLDVPKDVFAGMKKTMGVTDEEDSSIRDLLRKREYTV